MRIQARSPYFVQSTTGTTATLNIKIWTGDKINDKPAANTY